jgi:hypothetical protein
MNKLLQVSLLVGIMVLSVSLPAQAQRINQKSLEKTRWHNAPREFQILDERPVIRDFREAPAAEATIEIPPGPQAAGGSGGGGGAMSIPASIPAGGLQLGGPNQGFRSAPAGLGSLPKSGFGGPSNIPAGGFAPKGLQNGNSTNRLMGKMMPQGNGAGAGAPRGMSPSSGRSSGYSAPKAATYGGGYGTGSGGASGGSASRTDTMVRGTLLRR